MKILILLTDLFDTVGGIQSFNRSLVKALDEIADKKNLEVTILVLNDIPDKNASEHFHLHRIKCIFFQRSKLKFVISTISHAFSSSILFLGHVNFLSLGLGLRILNLPVQIFLMVYGIDAWKKLPVLQRISIKKIDKIISISNYTKQITISANSLEESKFLILPCTLDPEYDKKIILKSKNEMSLPDGKIILTVSRFSITEKLKNIDLVIRALPFVIKEVPDAYFVTAGDGDDIKRLKNIAKSIGVSERVIFAGRVPSDLLSSYYNLCDVFILPSEKEGFGIVFLEAMYFSKPCIGANRGGIPEVIEDGKTGFLVDPEDINSLSENIIKLLKDKNLCYSMGKSGKERFESEFSFERFRDRLEKILCH